MPCAEINTAMKMFDDLNTGYIVKFASEASAALHV
jgi:hypothetical protein